MKRFLFAATMTMFALSLPLRAAGDAAKGKEMFAKKCVMCHAADGAGAPAMKAKFGAKLRPLGSAEVQKAKDAELVKAFKDAVNHKVIGKSIQDADLDNLIAHIRTMK